MWESTGLIDQTMKGPFFNIWSIWCFVFTYILQMLFIYNIHFVWLYTFIDIGQDPTKNAIIFLEDLFVCFIFKSKQTDKQNSTTSHWCTDPQQIFQKMTGNVLTVIVKLQIVKYSKHTNKTWEYGTFSHHCGLHWVSSHF